VYGEPAVYKPLLGGAEEGFEVLEGRIGVLGEGVAGLLDEGPVLGGQVVEDVAVVEAEVDFGHFLAAGVATFQNGVSELLLNFNLDVLEVVYVVEEEGRDRLLVLGEEALVLRLLHKASQLKSQAFNGPVFVRRLTHHLLGHLFGVYEFQFIYVALPHAYSQVVVLLSPLLGQLPVRFPVVQVVPRVCCRTLRPSRAVPCHLLHCYQFVFASTL